MLLSAPQLIMRTCPSLAMEEGGLVFPLLSPQGGQPFLYCPTTELSTWPRQPVKSGHFPPNLSFPFSLSSANLVGSGSPRQRVYIPPAFPSGPRPPSCCPTHPCDQHTLLMEAGRWQSGWGWRMLVAGGKMCLNCPAPTCKLDSSDGG